MISTRISVIAAVAATVLLLLVLATFSADAHMTPNMVHCMKKCVRRAKSIKGCSSLCATVLSAMADAEEEMEVESDSFADNSGSLINQQLLWEQYRTEVLNALTKGTLSQKPYLQLLTSPIDATWDGENPLLLQKIADSVPYWNDYYDPSPYSISAQYKSLVNNVAAGRTVVDSGSKQFLDQYQRDFVSASNNEESSRLDCWKQYRQENAKLDIDSYEKTRCPVLVHWSNKVQELQAMIQFFTISAYGTTHQALLESRSAVQGNTEYKEVLSSLSKFKSDLKRGVFNPLRVSVSGLTQVTKSRKFSEASVALTRPSRLNSSTFQFLTTGDKNGMSTRRDQFKLDITFQSYAVVHLAPGDWFRTSVLERYGNGPFIHPQSSLFGTSGTMRLRAKTLYLVYRPRFEMTMSAQDAFNFNNAASKSSGGFFSSKSESSTVSTEVISNDSVKVIIQSNSNVPQIIAVDNEFLG